MRWLLASRLASVLSLLLLRPYISSRLVHDHRRGRAFSSRFSPPPLTSPELFLQSCLLQFASVSFHCHDSRYAPTISHITNSPTTARGRAIYSTGRRIFFLFPVVLFAASRLAASPLINRACLLGHPGRPGHLLVGCLSWNRRPVRALSPSSYSPLVPILVPFLAYWRSTALPGVHLPGPPQQPLPTLVNVHTSPPRPLGSSGDVVPRPRMLVAVYNHAQYSHIVRHPKTRALIEHRLFVLPAPSRQRRTSREFVVDLLSSFSASGFVFFVIFVVFSSSRLLVFHPECGVDWCFCVHPIV